MVEQQSLLMNSQLFAAYQDLVDTIDAILPEEWVSFKLTATYDQIGLCLGLKFRGADGVEEQFAGITPAVFDVIEAVRGASGTALLWSEWIFDCDQDGKYNVSVKYPDS